MTATKQLQQEHQAVKQALQILGVICDRLESKKDVDITHLENLLDFLRTFVDRCHHTKEEGALFPAMEKAGVPREGGPIGMMLIEHDQGRGCIKGLAESIILLKDGDKAGASGVVKNARGYISLLYQHIDKEDNILYMIADMHLSKSAQQKLLVEFERVENEVVGQGKHEEFHKMLNKLERLYL